MTLQNHPLPLPVSAEAIDALLPQTQCRQCGFDGCAAYAQAIAQGLAPINRCAPGGARGIAKLARATGLPETALDPEFGREVPFAVAHVRAADCIGCGGCAKACPTDAIAGAPKHLHGVIAERCTGCALCAPACPMDCIDFVETGAAWTDEDARRAKRLFEETWARRVKRRAQEDARLKALRADAGAAQALERKNFLADIMALARKRAQK